MKNMKISIQHTLLPEDELSESFQRAADYGFDGIELTSWGFSSPMYDHQAKIEKAMQASGLPVSSICATWEGNIVHPDPAERELRLAGLVEMPAHDLEPAFHRLGARVGEEHVVEVARQQGGQARRQLEAARMAHLKGR